MLKMDYQDKLSRFNVLSLTSVFHLFSGAARRSLASHIMGDRISDSGEFISSARKDNMQHNIEISETTFFNWSQIFLQSETQWEKVFLFPGTVF